MYPHDVHTKSRAASRRPIACFRIHSPILPPCSHESFTIGAGARPANPNPHPNPNPNQERGLLVEINNGRLAMLGIFGFLAESKIPGSVPALRLG